MFFYSFCYNFYRKTICTNECSVSFYIRMHFLNSAERNINFHGVIDNTALPALWRLTWETNLHKSPYCQLHVERSIRVRCTVQAFNRVCGKGWFHTRHAALILALIRNALACWKWVKHSGQRDAVRPGIRRVLTTRICYHANITST